MFLTYSAKRISSFFANFAAISEALNSNTVFKVLQTLRLFAFLIKLPKQSALLSEALNYTSNFHSIATQSNLFSSPPEHHVLAAKPSIITQKTYRATTRRRSTSSLLAIELIQSAAKPSTITLFSPAAQESIPAPAPKHQRTALQHHSPSGHISPGST